MIFFRYLNRLLLFLFLVNLWLPVGVIAKHKYKDEKRCYKYCDDSEGYKGKKCKYCNKDSKYHKEYCKSLLRD